MHIINNSRPSNTSTKSKLPTRRSPRNHTNTYVESYLSQYQKPKRRFKKDDLVKFLNKKDPLFERFGKVLATHHEYVHVEVFFVTTRPSPDNFVWRLEKNLQISQLPKFCQGVHKLAGDSDDSSDKSYRSDSSLDLGDSDSSVDNFYWSDNSCKMMDKEYV